MLAIKTNHISNLNLINSKATNDDHHWLTVKSVDTASELTNEYNNICENYCSKNKWVLMINPESESLDQLASSQNTHSEKILRVHSNKVNVSVNNIKTALDKGNCSVVVLCNPTFSENQLMQLSDYAKEGKTQCIVLKSNPVLH